MRVGLANSLPQEGETDRAGGVPRARFAVFHDFPARTADRANFSDRGYARDLRIRFAHLSDTMIDTVVVRHDREIPERWTLRENRTVETFGPVFKIAAGTIVEPCQCARLYYAPTLEETGRTHVNEKAQRVLVARRAAETRNIYMRSPRRHRCIHVYHDERRTHI